MKLYEFRQNNSGGSFDFDKDLDVHVFIEAHDARHANAIAGDFGIYFDGCSSGSDCSCCGDRWYEVYESDWRDHATRESFIEDIRQNLTWQYFTKIAGIIHTLAGMRYTITLANVLVENRLKPKEPSYYITLEKLADILYPPDVTELDELNKIVEALPS